MQASSLGPSIGRADRVARSDRESVRRCCAAEAEQRREQERNERGYDHADVRRLRAEIRRLWERMAEQDAKHRAEMDKLRTEQDAREQRLIEEIREALDYQQRGACRNGQTTQPYPR